MTGGGASMQAARATISRETSRRERCLGAWPLSLLGASAHQAVDTSPVIVFSSSSPLSVSSDFPPATEGRDNVCNDHHLSNEPIIWAPRTTTDVYDSVLARNKTRRGRYVCGQGYVRGALDFQAGNFAAKATAPPTTTFGSRCRFQ